MLFLLLHFGVQFLASDTEVVVVPVALAKKANLHTAAETVENLKSYKMIGELNTHHLVCVLVHFKLHGKIAAFATFQILERGHPNVLLEYSLIQLLANLATEQKTNFG